MTKQSGGTIALCALWFAPCIGAQPAKPAPAGGLSPISTVPAEYTPEARDAMLQGSVILSLEIDSWGRVLRAAPIQSLGMGLDERALAAVSQWRYRPNSRQQGPVIRQSAEIRFDLGKPNTWRLVRAAFHDMAPPRTALRTIGRPVLASYAVPDERPCSSGASAIVKFGIEKNGQPKNVEAIEEHGSGSGAAVVQAVMQWRYTPATFNGKKVKANARVEMECGRETPVRQAVVSSVLTDDSSEAAGSDLAQRVGPGMRAPVPIYRPEPEYSEEARKAKYQGTVVVYVEVDQTGRIRIMRVVRTLGLGLDEKAMEALTQWRFRPGMKDGNPVIVAATVEVNFKLL